MTVTNTATNTWRNTITNNEGIHTFPALEPGLYDVRVETAGVRSATSELDPQVQQTARQDFAPQVRQTSESMWPEFLDEQEVPGHRRSPAAVPL